MKTEKFSQILKSGGMGPDHIVEWLEQELDEKSESLNQTMKARNDEREAFQEKIRLLEAKLAKLERQGWRPFVIGLIAGIFWPYGLAILSYIIGFRSQ